MMENENIYFPITVFAKEDGNPIGIAHAKPVRYQGTKVVELTIIPTRDDKEYYHLAVLLKIPSPPNKCEEMKKLTLNDLETRFDEAIEDYEKILDSGMEDSNYEKHLDMDEKWTYSTLRDALHNYLQMDNMIAMIKYTSVLRPDDMLRLDKRKQDLTELLERYEIIHYKKRTDGENK